MRTPTGPFAIACALAAALLVAGCAGGDTRPHGDLLLEPVADRGPDPFTESTAATGLVLTAEGTPASTAPAPDSGAPAALRGVRTLSGATPGLYGGTHRVASCDVERQIRLLAADPDRTRAFARAEGVAPAAVPAYLRGLTSVVLRADTRVTGHGYRAGHADARQAVLQAGTAVLVDDRGVPRVRCACGNPLAPPVALRGEPGIAGHAWERYRPAEVVVVAPAPQVVTHFTLLGLADRAWIERPAGHRADRDRLVPPPAPPTPSSPTPSSPEPSTPPTGTPSPSAPDPGTAPGDTFGTPPPDGLGTPEPYDSPPGATPRRPDATAPWDTGPPATEPPDGERDGGSRRPVPAQPSPPVPGRPPGIPAPTDEVGPDTVPDLPGLPDGGGLVPDGTDAPADPTGTVFGSPTDVFDA
ncbi:MULTISPECIES: DUF6777 domain-containing protein [Streptomyces]|uniref:DUF6777 domain-containing protein n=2 Tax=Streptomyces TaxID=1883 RepID=A0A2U9PCP4_STRAS|nr:DUF6777 domain-containing protein [Streptomyces actuosus]AWT46734.1 hypothetical protein DMT42_33585 [Streptomyces actuosus]MBM4824134.1 hypothetical protein [Streptomyces actuosus]